MRTRYNHNNNNNGNQYYQTSSAKGTIFKLFVGILVLVVCTCIAFYRKSMETVFTVDDIQISDTAIVLTLEQKDPWLKTIGKTLNLEPNALDFLGINLDELGTETFRYVLKEKNENKMIEIHSKNDDTPKVEEKLTVDIDSTDGFICIKQNNGNYELVARKNETTGEWERTNWFDSLMHEFKNPWLF